MAGVRLLDSKQTNCILEPVVSRDSACTHQQCLFLPVENQHMPESQSRTCRGMAFPDHVSRKSCLGSIFIQRAVYALLTVSVPSCNTILFCIFNRAERQRGWKQWSRNRLLSSRLRTGSLYCHCYRSSSCQSISVYRISKLHPAGLCRTRQDLWWVVLQL